MSKQGIKYTIVNESGASKYSATPSAKKEFPDLDINLISSVSLARRLLDPLSEYVKINPQSLGVGQYQHDVNQTKLNIALTRVTTTIVNEVGVNLNTASVELLSYVAGINNSMAQKIVDYREEVGRFKSREELKKIKGMGAKTFTQCAGFLRIFGGNNKLDEYLVHPDDYKDAKRIAEHCKIEI